MVSIAFTSKQRVGGGGEPNKPRKKTPQSLGKKGRRKARQTKEESEANSETGRRDTPKRSKPGA